MQWMSWKVREKWKTYGVRLLPEKIGIFGVQTKDHRKNGYI